MEFDTANLGDEERVPDDTLIQIYALVFGALRSRQIVRTKNVVGDLGERYVESVFNRLDNLPNIELAPPNSKHIDATDVLGQTYAIKSLSGRVVRTGSFHFPSDYQEANRAFDFLLVVILDDNMDLRAIHQFTWEQFWRNKSWSKTQNAWYLPLSKKLLSAAKLVYEG